MFTILTSVSARWRARKALLVSFVLSQRYAHLACAALFAALVLHRSLTASAQARLPARVQVILSAEFRILAQVHRYLNSLWLLAEEHLGRLDFSCCYDADGCITDFGRERASQAAVKSGKSMSKDSRLTVGFVVMQRQCLLRLICPLVSVMPDSGLSHSDCACSGIAKIAGILFSLSALIRISWRSVNDAEKARQKQTEQTLRRWRLCRWPRHDHAGANAPGSGSWETLSVDCKMLKCVKSCLDTGCLGAPTPVSPGTNVKTEEYEECQEDGCVRSQGVGEQECSSEGASDKPQATPVCAETQGGKNEKLGCGRIGREPLAALSQLAGKVLSDVAAEEERRQRAEQLRLLAEAEAKRKQDRIRRQLGDAAVSSSNIISERPERRARNVVNYAEADREAERQLRRYVNYTEFGKGKSPFIDNSSSDDESRPRRKRVTRESRAAPPPQESRADRLRRRGGAVDEDEASGSSRPKRAAAMASSYGQRRLSSSDSGNEEWVSGESDGDGEQDADGSDVGEDDVEEEGNEKCLDEHDAHDEVRNDASASSTGRVGSDLASNKDEKSLAGPDEEDHSPRKRRKIVDDEEEDENYGREAAGREGEHERSAIAVDDQSGALDRNEAHEKDLRVRNSSDPAAIAALVKGRERASWVGKSVRKHFRQHG